MGKSGNSPKRAFLAQLAPFGAKLQFAKPRLDFPSILRPTPIQGDLTNLGQKAQCTCTACVRYQMMEAFFDPAEAEITDFNGR